MKISRAMSTIPEENVIGVCKNCRHDAAVFLMVAIWSSQKSPLTSLYEILAYRYVLICNIIHVQITNTTKYA